MTIKPRDFTGSSYRVKPDKNVIETSVGVYTDQVYKGKGKADRL